MDGGVKAEEDTAEAGAGADMDADMGARVNADADNDGGDDEAPLVFIKGGAVGAIGVEYDEDGGRSDCAFGECKW